MIAYPRPGMSDPFMAQWRHLVLSDPGRATGQLREFLDSSYRPPSPIAADLEVLLAETLHRRQALAVAFDTSWKRR